MRKCEKCIKTEGPFVVLKGYVLCAKCKYQHLDQLYNLEKQKLERKVKQTYLDAVKPLLLLPTPL